MFLNWVVIKSLTTSVGAAPGLVKLYAESLFGKIICMEQELFDSGDASAKIADLLFP